MWKSGEATHYRDVMAQATTAIGLLDGRDVEGGFVTHDPRHTSVTYLMQAEYDLKTVAALYLIVLLLHEVKLTIPS